MASSFDPNQDEGINDINITPFVDVVLVLLVIFMVTAPMMVKESLNLKLPETKSADTAEPARLGISVNRNGIILVNGETMTSQALSAIALKSFTENPKVQALISADKEASHGSVIEVLDIIKTVGIDNFAFQIERSLEK